MQTRMHVHVSKLSLLLQTVSIGSLGRVEQQMQDAGGELQGIKLAIDGISAHVSANDRPDSILTTYSNDDKTVWKAFRRDLIGAGVSSELIHRHKDLIKAYVGELADRASIHNESADTPILKQGAVRRYDDLIVNVAYAKDTERIARSAQRVLGTADTFSVQGLPVIEEASSPSPDEREHRRPAARIGTTLTDYQDTRARQTHEQTSILVSRNNAALLEAHLATRIAELYGFVGTGSPAISPAPALSTLHLEISCEMLNVIRLALIYS